MTEVPENWHRVTPALAGRRAARGVPAPIAIAAMILGVVTIFGLKSFVGYWVAVFLGCIVTVSLIGAVRLCAPNDRDWFEILMELLDHKFEIAKFELWEWWYKW